MSKVRKVENRIAYVVDISGVIPFDKWVRSTPQGPNSSGLLFQSTVSTYFPLPRIRE